jgi:quinoprotein glucose dehydrogenase
MLQSKAFFKWVCPAFFTLVLFTAAAQPIPPVTLQPVFTKFSALPGHGGQDDQYGRPVWMSEVPDGSGRMFVVYQKGTIWVMKKNSDGADAKLFLDISGREPAKAGNEDGLLSIAFHPGFVTNGLFYIYYNQINSQDDMRRIQRNLPIAFPFRSVVSEFKVSANDPDQADMKSERVLLEVPQPFSNHKGGEVCFGPDGYLYLCLGDGGLADDPFGNGQNTATLLAKMLRIDVNSRSTVGRGMRRHELQYGIPQDNPFVNEPDMMAASQKEIYAWGLRNPFRYSFDRATGALWAGDVGQDLWEAVYIIVKGGNYGWSVTEAGHHFKPRPEGAQYITPVIDYPHRPNLQSQSIFPDHTTGLCVIGGYVYRGKQFPALDGIYIYGDYNYGTIWGLRYDYDAKKVTAEGTMLLQKELITSFAEDADGELYALMQDGAIYKITSP